MSDVSDFSLPTDPKEILKIKNAIQEISGQNQMIDDRKEAIKDIKKDLKDSYDMPISLINKLVKALDDHEYMEMSEEHSVFELTRETILGTVSDDIVDDENYED